MKTRSTGIFSRIGFFIFIAITALSILFVVVTYTATTEYYQASTQLLNKDIAEHIAKFSAPFNNGGIDRKKADSVFYNTMIISPNTEVYFLDTTGMVKYYHAPDSLIKERKVPLANIETYLNDPLHEIKNLDPRDPETPKIFSAAEVRVGENKIGYIYVILVSRESRNVAELVFKSRVGGWATKVFFIVIIITLIFSVFYTSRLQRRFNRVIAVLDRFKEGDLNVRFDTTNKDEFSPIAEAFNKMVALLDDNFNRLKMVETERKTFLANISHDLRTPLAVARGYTETLLMTPDEYSKAQQGQMDMILSKIMQVEKLVLQLFELSRMESVDFTPVMEPFVFSEILQETIRGIELQAKPKNINVICNNCEDGAFISADIGMMERVIQNLLENALKYTPEGGYIAITLSREAGKLLVTIANNGKALPDQIYTWVNNSIEAETINRPAGTGLGLALVKRILQLHGFSFAVNRTNDNENSFVFGITIYTNTAKRVS